MPVITVNALELLEEQKKIIARKYTDILAEQTKVPPERIYVFFGGYPLDGIAAGGVLNSEIPPEILKQFVIKYTAEMAATSSITVLTRMKAKAGLESVARQVIMSLLLQTRNEPGCLGYDLYQSERDLYRKRDTTSFFVLQEKWRNQEAIGEHLAMPYFTDFMAAKDALFDGPLEVTAATGMSKRTATLDLTDKLKVVLRLKAREGKEEAIEQGLLELMEIMRSQPGCLRYDIYQGFEGIYDTSVFTADQVWSDQEALDRALQHVMTNLPFFLEDLDGPREPITFDMVSEPAAEPKGAPPADISIKDNAILGDKDLMTGLRKMNPAFGELCIETSAKAYGMPLLDQKTKVLIAIAVDIIEQITGKPFENHVHMAMKQGITRDELEELFLFMTTYAGFNKAGVFYPALNQVLGVR